MFSLSLQFLTFDLPFWPLLSARLVLSMNIPKGLGENVNQLFTILHVKLLLFSFPPVRKCIATFISTQFNLTFYFPVAQLLKHFCNSVWDINLKNFLSPTNFVSLLLPSSLTFSGHLQTHSTAQGEEQHRQYLTVTDIHSYHRYSSHSHWKSWLYLSNFLALSCSFCQ